MKDLKPNVSPLCGIRGHNHSLNHHRVLVQHGSGMVADLWECPSGAYRFLLLRKHLVAGMIVDGKAHGLRHNRPRYGWASSDKKLDRIEAELGYTEPVL